MKVQLRLPVPHTRGTLELLLEVDVDVEVEVEVEVEIEVVKEFDTAAHDP